jgi:hypothetical protein
MCIVVFSGMIIPPRTEEDQEKGKPVLQGGKRLYGAADVISQWLKLGGGGVTCSQLDTGI